MLNLGVARKIIGDVFHHAYSFGLKPMSVAVLDAGGHVIAFERQDGASNLRFKVAFGKSALAMGVGSRKLYQRAQKQPYFINAINALADGALVPVPGGILIRNSDTKIIGAVGITGDNSDSDDVYAVYAIEQAGLIADPG